MYLDYAENQAARQIPMKMKDWIGKLDGFLQFCKIRMIPDTPTDLFRTVLPIYSGHPYRFIADSGTE